MPARRNDKRGKLVERRHLREEVTVVGGHLEGVAVEAEEEEAVEEEEEGVEEEEAVGGDWKCVELCLHQLDGQSCESCRGQDVSGCESQKKKKKKKVVAKIILSVIG